MKPVCLSLSLLIVTTFVAGNAVAQTYSYSKTEVVTYADNTSTWVMGQVSSVTCAASIPVSTACDGDVASATTYDPSSSLPIAAAAFGKPQSSATFNADGTLATIKDGNYKTTTYSNWSRGIPQNVLYADNTTQSASVDGNGWIMSVTDENGYTTGYGYDAMGRLASISYPAGWSNTTRTFVSVTATEYGIPAGHWRETVTTGNAVKITYYDGMWRPLLIREYDSNAETATKRFTRMGYDTEGRLTFSSYPVNSCGAPSSPCSPTTGLSKAYDALGRVTGVSQNSEYGSIGTTTSYESGYLTVVTDPKGNATISSYLTYDQPVTDWPLIINAEEGQTTAFSRDPHGKPTSIVRSGGGRSVTRSYTYNGYQELCKSVEPETSATLYRYDGAGNLVASASGQSTTVKCGGGMLNAVGRMYDNRNRLTSLTFPGGNGNQTWTYTPDGLPEMVTTYNDGNEVTNSYVYNNRRLLTGEGMLPDTVQTSWAIGYGYDGLGHITTETRPGSVTLTYAVNALGQVTQVSASSDTEGAVTLASSATYFPNGALKQFAYGNGIVHTMTQNARMLPSRSTDCAVTGSCSVASNRKLDLAFSYDGNGNVSAIEDGTPGARQSRGMGYDKLDRLTFVGSTMFGNANYTYDAIDNLTEVTVGGPSTRTHYYCYNAANQLSFVRSGPLCTGTGDPAVISLGYDDRGNVANKNGATYNFDYGNRLRTAAGVTYRYDAEGRRVRQDNAGSQFKYSFYAKNGRLIWQRDEVTRHRVNYVYLSGDTIAEYMRPIGVPAATITYVHTDAQGSPIAKTNASKVVTEASEYEPYGKLLNRPNDDRAGYTGHVMDSATGLTYMQQRYYDPTIGRFLSVDPVTVQNKNGANFNRYWYGNNNPYRFNDPDGRYSCEASVCPVVASSLRTARDQMNTLTPGSAAHRTLARSLGRIGTENAKDNKVVYKDGSSFLPSTSAARFTPSATPGEGVTFLNLSLKPTAVNLVSEMAHEVEHQLDPASYKNDNKRDDFMRLETNAYKATFAVFKAFGQVPKKSFEDYVNGSVEKDMKAQATGERSE